MSKPFYISLNGVSWSLKKIPENELECAVLDLRPTPDVTSRVQAMGTGETQNFAGCATWGRKDWIGKFYPVGTKEKYFLQYYATRFNGIDFNGILYNIHFPQQAEKWVSVFTEGILFCPKYTQSVTHIRSLKNGLEGCYFYASAP